MGEPSVGEALAMLDRALEVLAGVDAASLATVTQAEMLRALERAGSRQTAARARVLAAFLAQDGCAADGQGTAKSWLRWQTRITTAAAAGAVGWARRLSQHPVIAAALASGDLSASWAQAICGWTGRLPEARRGDADQILADAAAGGADLADLAGLAEEMYRRAAGPDTGRDESFGDRYLNVGTTWQGAGRVEGDLTPGCAAALTAVIEALGRKAGPEDTRTAAQRRHDALEEACRRLIAAGMIPARAGQPTQIMLHLTLSQLRDLPAAAEAEAEWAAARASQPGWLTGPAADAAACDATLIPLVTGHLDPAALDYLTHTLLTHHPTSEPAGGPAGSGPAGTSPPASGPASGPAGSSPPGTSPPGTSPPGTSAPVSRRAGSGPPGSGPASEDRGQTGQQATAGSSACGAGTGQPPGPAAAPGSDPGPQPSQASQPPGTGERPLPLADATRQRLRSALLTLAADVLSGPSGLAARLRSGLGGPEAATPSLPLDIAAATDIIPTHLRRAATARHRHCAFPGCRQPASTCQLHHLIPRRQGGPTTLANLAPLCSFHHLIAIHTWGWQLTLHPDGTTTATSPDGTRTFHSHGPPGLAA